MLLSTGWEDYYASSWGMVDGPFNSDIAGTTHWASQTKPGTVVHGVHTTRRQFA